MKDDIIYKENNEISNETMRNITPKQERKMKKRILIVTNHSYMFWQFRKELVEALQKEHGNRVYSRIHEPTWRESFCRGKAVAGL